MNLYASESKARNVHVPHLYLAVFVQEGACFFQGKNVCSEEKVVDSGLLPFFMAAKFVLEV